MLRGEINPIGDTVTIVVIVKEIGGAITVEIATGGARCARVKEALFWAFNAIGQAIIIAIGLERVWIPALTSDQQPRHLHPIGQAITITIEIGGVGAQGVDLWPVGQAIPIAVGDGRVAAPFGFEAVTQAIAIAVGTVGAGGLRQRQAKGHGLNGVIAFVDRAFREAPCCQT